MSRGRRKEVGLSTGVAEWGGSRTLPLFLALAAGEMTAPAQAGQRRKSERDCGRRADRGSAHDKEERNELAGVRR